MQSLDPFHIDHADGGECGPSGTLEKRQQKQVALQRIVPTFGARSGRTKNNQGPITVGQVVGHFAAMVTGSGVLLLEGGIVLFIEND